MWVRVPSPVQTLSFFENKGENNMDILSFILGMSIVVVIAVAVVAVIAFVRVNRDRTDSERQIYSVLDSRLDKLESKITNSRKA